MNFPYIEIEGTPYEIGFQEGENFKEQIQGSIDCYKAMFMDYSNLSWDRAKALSKQFIPVITEYNQDYIAEMQGISDGSGFDFEDILALNCRSELVFVGKEFDKVDGGCTSIGISRDAGISSNAFLAHNWDWKTSQRSSMVMMKITQKNGKPTIFMVTEAGIIGKTGFNSAGVCLYLNALSTDQAPAGLPLHMAMRGILDCKTIAEAIGTATRMPLGCCASFMIGHKNGECVVLEIENEDFDVLYPKDGILIHTNHFISPRLPRAPRKDTCKYKLPDSFVRLGRAEKIMRKKEKYITPEDIMVVLKDHVEYPTSICRHNDPEVEPGLQMGTVFSMIANLTTGAIYFCKGNPCENEYEMYHIDLI
ncbi:C45 family peptidase [Eubacterium sp. 1001713B170207_170306_E7]|uniref:C45 family autoproteolytic acyltransferase/hydolase n=1 Tax=Eubacterium sp. 1001713B170207_170306_E7 TaxID=2787097 RepID=UPI00189C3AEF|nr:C45 family peptidase [Eubacterium sp. 1001713B170207_170306_E7]